MIRGSIDNDIEAILDIWLSASIESHDFIEPAFWESQVESMRNIYLPSSDVYVYEHHGEVVGFYALHNDTLAAIFVSPQHQGKGIGKKLIAHAEKQCGALSLTVYKENERSVRFYLRQGFEPVGEQVDPNTGHKEINMRKNL